MTFVGVVCARAGSVGIPDKNLLELDGRSLLEHAITKSRCSFESTYISTDIPQAAWEGATGHGCYTVGRPAQLRGPLVSKWQVWQHVAKFLNASAIVDIDVSRPLTTAEDLMAVVHAYVATDAADAMIAVTPAKKNPYQDILETTESDCLRPSKAQGAYVVARQDRPMAYEHGGIYVIATDALRSSAKDLWDIQTVGCVIPWSHTVSIDDWDDWVMVQALHETLKVER